MKENRSVTRWFAGLTVIGALFLGGIAPAQAASVDHSAGNVAQKMKCDTGWG